MAAERHTLAALAGHLIRASRPLIHAAASVDSFRNLMARLGFEPTSMPAPMASLSVTVDGANVKVDTASAAASIKEILDLLGDAKAIFEAIQNLQATPPAGVDAAAWSAEVGSGIFARLLTDYLARELPVASGVLGALGVIEFENVFESPGRPPFVRPKIDWSALTKLLSDPSSWPTRAFGWGTPQFDAQIP